MKAAQYSKAQVNEIVRKAIEEQFDRITQWQQQEPPPIHSDLPGAIIKYMQASTYKGCEVITLKGGGFKLTECLRALGVAKDTLGNTLKAMLDSGTLHTARGSALRSDLQQSGASANLDYDLKECKAAAANKRAKIRIDNWMAR